MVKRVVGENRVLRLLGLSYILRIIPLLHPIGLLLSGYCWRKLTIKTFHNILLPLLFFLVAIFSLVFMGASLKLNVYKGNVIVEPVDADLYVLTKNMNIIYDALKSETTIHNTMATLLGSLTVIIEALSINKFMETSLSSKRRLLRTTLILFVALATMSMLYILVAYSIRKIIEELLSSIEKINPTDVFASRVIQEKFSGLLQTLSIYTLVTVILSYYTHLTLAYLMLKQHVHIRKSRE